MRNIEGLRVDYEEKRDVESYTELSPSSTEHLTEPPTQLHELFRNIPLRNKGC